MDKVEICYFSGTGNSLAVARDMAEELGAKLTPVTSMINQESINIEADAIGFVFPLYDSKPPLIIEDSIRKSEGIGSKYLFAVCTYGIAPVRSLRHLEKVIESCGGHLSGGFAVAMPHSGIGCSTITKAQREGMFKNWKDRSEEICKYIDAREKGKIESSSPLLALPRFVRMAPSLLKFMKQVLLKGIDSLALTSDENCDGCGICERICPVNNIEVVGNRPVWSDHCAGCFACLHWCPKGAISPGGLDMGIGTYHHPDVRLSDMMRQK